MINLSKRYNYIIILIILLSLLFIICNIYNTNKIKETFTDTIIEPTPTPTPKFDLQEYVKSFSVKENRMFPFRYFTDINNNVLPFVAITGFFRGDDAKIKYYEYVKNGIFIFGITAYKSFPNKKMLDNSEGEYERNDTFNYTENIKDWLCCFRNKENYGFTNKNHTIDISESDFYNSEADINKEKLYDFIYICNKDGDSCPLNGWNAINRNFDLALKCFPIMMNEFKLKGLIVGRSGCGLEEKYGDRIEISDWLDWHLLQEKMKQSKFLFVPNIFDASPRVIAECITKDLPVLMNENILCGYKYINYETGEFFTDENNIKPALTKLLDKMGKISPTKWWSENYSQEKCYKKLRNFLLESFGSSLNGILDNIDQVKFIL
jgi:hypothetical protein